MSTLNNNSFTPQSWFSSQIDSHIPTINFSSGSLEQTTTNYSDFSYSVSPTNRIITLGQDFGSKVSQARHDKANALNLRGVDYSNYVELNVLPSLDSKRDDNLSRLTTVIPDDNFELPSTPISSTKLVEVIKDSSEQSNDIESMKLEAFNHLTTLFQNQNDMISQSNEIALEANRINEAKFIAQDAMNKSLVEGLMSIGQSLEFMPTLIEAISIGSDNIQSVLNISNEHAYQKNVNDSYAFNYDKDDEKGTKRSLDAISTHLSRSANALHETEKHQKKQGDFAHEEKKIIDEENSSSYLSFISDLGDSITGEFFDFDIFTYLLENTTEAGRRS